MRIASIDVGTNTVLLLIADIDRSGLIAPIHNEQRLPRLGQGVDATGRLHSAAFDRVAWVLREYKNLAIQFRSDKILACGTSALRDATNKQEFLDYIMSTVGITLEVMSGQQEALWTYRGTLSGQQKSSVPLAVVDIGGGSTEITFPRANYQVESSELNQYSFQCGSVRVTERYFKHDPPTSYEIEEARHFIQNQIERIPPPEIPTMSWLAVAGTATTLACLDQKLEQFHAEKVDGYHLSSSKAELWLNTLSRMTTKDIRALSMATEGRADILLAGVLILHEVMRAYRIEGFQVSDRGLRHGLIVREWEKTREEINR